MDKHRGFPGCFVTSFVCIESIHTHILITSLFHSRRGERINTLYGVVIYRSDPIAQFVFLVVIQSRCASGCVPIIIKPADRRIGLPGHVGLNRSASSFFGQVESNLIAQVTHWFS